MKQNQMTELQNLTDEEETMVEELMTKKYQTWEWNYGNSPNYSMNKKIRTKGGTVQVIADIQKGVIRDLRFYGDFFSKKNPDELIGKLIGIAHTETALKEVLCNIDVQEYLNGVTNEELLGLINT